MLNKSTPLAFNGGQSNDYAQDVERLATFYRDHFGFKETYDVDGAHTMLMAHKVYCIREPHNFDVNEKLRLRVAWYEDPEGNIFQTVCQRSL